MNEFFFLVFEKCLHCFESGHNIYFTLQGRGVIGHLRRAHDGSTGQAVLPAHETAIEADLFFNSLIRTSQMLSSAAGMRG